MILHRCCLPIAALLASGASLTACAGSSLPLEGNGGSGGLPSNGGGAGLLLGSGGAAGHPNTGGRTSIGGAPASNGGMFASTAGSSSNSGGAGGSGGTGGSDATGGTSRFSADEIAGDPYGDFGTTATFAGDLDGDGYADFLVADGGGSGPERAVAVGTRGALYGFYGRPGLPAHFSAGDADFILDGMGNVVSGIGDFDGDGYDDFAFVQACEAQIGCLPTNGLHVVFGGAARLTGEHRADEVGVTWLAPRDDANYENVRGAGDVNGDGLADVLVDAGTLGWSSQDTLEPISSYLLLGRGDRSTLAGSAPDASFEGQSGQYQVNYGATGVGDLDGDGFDDLAISTENTTPGDFTGTINLFYGAADRFHGSLAPGDADATFPWYSYFISFGRLGDLDGDGYADLAVPGIDSQQNWALRIVYGKSARFSGAYGDDAADLLVTTPGQFAGLATGDVNGDGRVDLVVGDSDANQGAGWLALVPGVAGRRRGTYAISDADVMLYGQSRPEEGLGGSPEVDFLGNGVGTGDVDGDGIDDVIVGAQGNVGGDLSGGRAFLVFGTAE